MGQRAAAILRVNDALLAGFPDVYGADPQRRCLALSEALAASPAWARLRGEARLAVRPASGLIGILGSVADQDRPLVDALGSRVQDLLTRLLPISYRDVEAACVELAGRLRSELTEAELDECRLMPIPRGGLIVASLVAYALGLRRDQLEPDPTSEALAIVVDDCAESGTRVRQWLAGHGSGNVVVAVLHAHPDLARRIADDEPRVRLCIAARPLTDHAPRRPDYEAWVERWTERSPTDYWIGNPDHVVYPWSEPDVRVWNPVTSRAEAAWRVVPPSWCAKNRADDRSADLQHCVAAPGAVEPAPDVIWARFDSEVAIARVDQATAIALRGTAAAMWSAIIGSGHPDRAADTVASAYDADPSVVRSDVDRFVAQLVERGYLSRDH